MARLAEGQRAQRGPNMGPAKEMLIEDREGSQTSGFFWQRNRWNSRRAFVSPQPMRCRHPPFIFTNILATNDRRRKYARSFLGLHQCLRQGQSGANCQYVYILSQAHCTHALLTGYFNSRVQCLTPSIWCRIALSRSRKCIPPDVAHLPPSHRVSKYTSKKRNKR